MSETMFAAGLGLVIPVLAIPVCRKLWKCGLSKARGRASPDGAGLLKVGFALQLSCLLVACYAFNRVASSIQTEAEHFDPYQILDLPQKANSSVIRSQYRRLSLKHHPDKNPGKRREANKKFNEVANAYKALSDPTARRNWELYGHPDGYIPWTFDLALPAWVRPGKDTGNGTLILYGVGYLAVLAGFLLSVKVGLDLLDPVGAGKKPEFEATEEDVMALLHNLDDTSSTEDVLECLASCPQLCTAERRSLAEEMESITSPVRDWLVTLQGPGAKLLAPRPPSSSGPPTPSKPLPQPKSTLSRKGKGKGAGKAKGKAKGAAAAASPQEGQGQDPAEEEEKAVEEEFFSFGRKGEGSRRDARGTPRLSTVVEHNLIVLLSALHRASAGGGAVTVVAAAVAAAAATNASDSSSSGDGDDGDNSAAVREAEEAAVLAAAAHAAAHAEDGKLEREQGVVFGLAEPLLDACLSVAGKRASPQLFGTVIEAKALLRRRLWSSDDPLALDRQEREADVELDAAVPSVKVESIVVETWGESQVALGDTVTATITIARLHAPEYRGFRRRRPEAAFIAKGEPWWVILAGGAGGNTMIGATPMLVENLGSDVAKCQIKFQAPRRPGFVPLMAFVKSPVFVGVDCEGEGTFRVYRHEDLKEDDDAGDW